METPRTYINPQSKIGLLADAGHGGIINRTYQTYPHKMKDFGDFVFYEGVFNRLIVEAVSRALLKVGISYFKVTDTEIDVLLQKRCDVANLIIKEPGYNNIQWIFTSFHGNYFGVESVNGIEGYTSPGHTKADPVCDFQLSRLSELNLKMRYGLGEGYTGEKVSDLDKEARFKVLMGTTMPATLLELGFFSNRQEAELMMTEKYHNDVAEKIALSMLDIQKNFNKIF